MKLGPVQILHVSSVSSIYFDWWYHRSARYVRTGNDFLFCDYDLIIAIKKIKCTGNLIILFLLMSIALHWTWFKYSINCNAKKKGRPM